MKETRYYVKLTKDGKYRFYFQEAEVTVISERQAKKADIKRALEDVKAKRDAYDLALLEYIK